MTPSAGFLTRLVPGQRVHHRKFGLGQVLRSHQVDGAERAWIDFGRRGVLELALREARLTDPDAAPADRPGAAWEELVDLSVSLPPLGLEPWVAWLGPAVVGDGAAFLEVLDRLKSEPRGVYPVVPWATGSAPGWPEVEVFMLPAPTGTLPQAHAGVIVLSAPLGRRPWVTLPFYSDWGRVQRVVPRAIRVCDGRVEAVVEADLQRAGTNTPIVFGLPTFCLGRTWLQSNVPVSVSLTALAIACRPSSAFTFTVQHDRDRLDALLRHGVDLVSAPAGSTTYTTEGASIWIPRAGRGDTADFRGHVVAARRIVLPPLQQDGWNLTLRLSAPGDAEWLLETVFAASVWAADDAPVVGSDVEGYAWLVGECLGPG